VQIKLLGACGVGYFYLQISYQALQDQYLALVFGPGVSQLCRARKFALRPGSFLRIFIFGSPNVTRTTFPLSLT